MALAMSAIQFGVFLLNPDRPSGYFYFSLSAFTAWIAVNGLLAGRQRRALLAACTNYEQLRRVVAVSYAAHTIALVLLHDPFALYPKEKAE